MDIKKIITDAVEKLTKDESLKKEFLANPVKALEKITGIDLPDEQIQPIIDGIKAKLNLDAIGDKLGAIGKLFGK